MSRVVAFGDERRLGGYGLAGALVVAAAPADAAAAWDALPADVGLVVLTPEVVAVLGHRLDERPGLVWAVLP